MHTQSRTFHHTSSQNLSTKGLLTCINYSIPPNTLHYCGPDKNETIINYQIQQETSDELTHIIEQFHTLYAYLTLIAWENNIKDPFDAQVVEAYWIGNRLLHNVSMKKFYEYLAHKQGLKKRLKPRDFYWLAGKLDEGALPHHTFHVLNVFTRTDHHAAEHTLETMDACRISWGKVMESEIVLDPTLDPTGLGSELVRSIRVKTNPLVIKNGKLAIGNQIIKEIQIQSHLVPDTNNLKPGTYVSFHWNTLCDIITEKQAHSLERYTKLAISLANNTI